MSTPASQAKATPGPWHYAEGAITCDSRVIGYASASALAADANGRLIAAAPDLLAALQAIVKSLSDQDDEGLIEHADQMVAARAAIAAATGEQP